MKIALYTAVFGGYDVLSDLRSCGDFTDIDLVCFSDNKSGYKGWQNRYVEPLKEDTSEFRYARTNRYYKLNPHLFLKDYDVNIYVDGHVKSCNVDLVRNYAAQVFYSSDYDMITGIHEHRVGIWKESKVVVERQRDFKDVVEKQVKQYMSSGFPNDILLTANGIMFRKTHSLLLKEFNEFWWNEVRTKSYRDQLSFAYSVWKKQFWRYRVITNRLKIFQLGAHEKGVVSVLGDR